MKLSKAVGTPRRVQAYNFGKWLNNLDLQDQDRLLLKIYIEGAKVDPLEHITHTTVLCQFKNFPAIDKLYQRDFNSEA